MMDSGDHLMTQSRTCLGSLVEAKDITQPEPKPETEPGLSRDYHGCPVSGLPMQCISYGDKLRYGDQLLPDQILSSEKTEESKSDSDNDPEDHSTKNIFESLLLDKCSNEEPLMTNPNQDWGCFESFISESKIELLDLCSKNELSVNLFSEDVENYMFDEEEDSTLGTNVCSLKIRYESFQDNIREKTNAIQEETKINFFPSVAARNGSNGPYDDDEAFCPAEGKINQTISGCAEGKQSVSQKSSRLSDVKDSGEYSDDNSCSGSSLDTCQIKRKHHFLSRENSSFSCQLSYGLRSKRKGRYSEDYLYDVDSLENEKIIEKKEEKEKPKVGLRKERDDDWCPKKKRKYLPREPPVVIKYIITNRFKGEKHMLVKLVKLDRFEKTVTLNEDLVKRYKRLSPLKDYWEIQQAMLEQCKLFTTDQNKHLNGGRRSRNSRSPRRKNRTANRVRIQRIHTVTPLLNSNIDVSMELVPAATDLQGEKTLPPGCASTLKQGVVTRISRSQMWKDARQGNKAVKLHKFKSEARLRSLKMRKIQHEVDKTKIGLQEVIPITFHPNLSIDKSIATSTKITSCNNAIIPPAPCSTTKQSINVNSTLSDFAGGYLRSLLDGTDLQSSFDISYYPQKQHSMQLSPDISQEDSPFRNLQLAQGSILSRPTESIIKPSPSICTNLLEPEVSAVWQSATETLSFEQDIAPASTVLDVGIASQGQESECSQVNLNNTRLYLPVEPTLTCKIATEDRRIALDRVILNSDNGRLAHSVSQLSAPSNSYSSLSHQSGEKDNEQDVNNNLLVHCNPKRVVQQSGYEIVLPRESTDLLDISNFTPDMFRQSSVSEMSPPTTPCLSPQTTGPECSESLGKEGEFPKTSEVRWESSVASQQNHYAGAGNIHHFQFHSLNGEDHTGSAQNIATEIEETVESVGRGVIVHKSKRKNTSKHNPGQRQDSVGERRGINKAKTPRAAKTENSKQTKSQQTSCASKTMKSLNNAKMTNKMHSDAASKGLSGLTEDWPLMQEHVGIWLDGNCKNPVEDNQREFEEPSNILSNIVSGMAEVQKFMKVSIEPLWDPMTRLGQFPDANSLNTKTLKILAGTTTVINKNAGYVAATRTGSRKKVAGKGANNAAKFIPSEPFFPSLSLDGGMFHKHNLSLPGTRRPAHKKMYRHKTSAKFASESSKGKTDSGKNVASYEKRR